MFSSEILLARSEAAEDVNAHYAAGRPAVAVALPGVLDGEIRQHSAGP
jgi:hypothetical protein